MGHLARSEKIGGHLPKSVGGDNGNTTQKQTQANVRAAAPTALFVMVFGSAQLAQTTIRLGVFPLRDNVVLTMSEGDAEVSGGVGTTKVSKFRCVDPFDLKVLGDGESTLHLTGFQGGPSLTVLCPERAEMAAEEMRKTLLKP